MDTSTATQAQLLELCSMLRAIAISHKDAGRLLRQMAEVYKVRASIAQTPIYRG